MYNLVGIGVNTIHIFGLMRPNLNNVALEAVEASTTLTTVEIDKNKMCLCRKAMIQIAHAIRRPLNMWEIQLNEWMNERINEWINGMQCTLCAK